MIKYIVSCTFGLLLFIFIGCNTKHPQETPVSFGTEKFDSTALHIALTPNRASFPIFYAQQSGIYKKLGLHLQIASYPSQLDCDTALLGKFADGGMMDYQRLENYKERARHLHISWQTYNPLQLFSSNGLRIRSVKNLQGHTVGIARQSTDETALNQALQTAQLTFDQVFCPLINNQKLRAEMLSGNQIDAAILAWPYNSFASALQHRLIYTYPDKDRSLCMVQNKNTKDKDRTKAQWKLFEKGRKMAIDSLKHMNRDITSLILQQEYGLPKEVADTINF